MGNCGSRVNCTVDIYDQFTSTINADPDIVGGGVLTSFLLTAIITLIAIIYGCFSDSIPEWYLNEADGVILNRYRATWIARKAVPALTGLASRIIRLIRTLLCRHENTEAHILSRDQRIEALTRFVLALSDQQLVTGLAILIGALASRCKISAYEFDVVIGLAWFSSTTHLATLDVLRDYFIRNQIVRNVRLVGMLILMGILAFGVIVIDTTAYVSVQALQCAIEGLKSSGQDPQSSIYTVNTLAFLIFSYAEKIGHLYDDDLEEGQQLYSNRERILQLFMRLRHPNLDVSKRFYKRIIKTVVSEERAKTKRNLQRKARKSKTMKSALFWTVAAQACFESFLFNMATWLLGLSYGITQVIATRFFYAPKMSEDANDMSFGQVVPLFLLVIPALAAAEIYYEAPKPFKDERHRRSVSSKSAISDSQVSRTTEQGKLRLPRELQLPDPIHQPPHRQQIERFYYISEHGSEESTLLHSRDSTHTKARLLSPSNQNKTQLSLALTDQLDAPKMAGAPLQVHYTSCLVAIFIGVFMNIGAGVFASAVFLLAIYVSLLINAFHNVYLEYKPAFKRLRECAESEQRGEAITRAIDNDDDDNDGVSSLHEVVVSRNPSGEGSIYMMHGGLGPDPDFEPQAPHPVSTEEADHSTHASEQSPQGENERTNFQTPTEPDDDEQQQQQQQSSIDTAQASLKRQDTASSTAKEAPAKGSGPERLIRRVNTLAANDTE